MAIKYYNKSLEESPKYIENKSVDLFFLDPPYFISGKSKNIDLETGDRSDWDCQWDNIEEYSEWTDSYLKMVHNQLKDNGSAYICISWQNSHIIH